MHARILALLAFVAAALPLSPAKAAPQILGLVASNGMVPLHCADGACTAELSAFCLQQDREVPPAGTAYRPIDGAELRLVATTANGETQRLGALGHAQFFSLRNYTAVKVSIAADVIASLGAVSLALEIGDGVALVPEAVAGDPRPQTDSDIAIAANTLRPAGTQIVDRSAAVASARALNRIVSVLSPDAHDRVTPRDELWQDRVERFEDDLDKPGIDRAAHAYESCYADRTHDSDAALRWCLQVRHDALIIELNSDYWASVRTGS